MKKNILQQVIREEQYTIIVIDTPESFNETTGEVIPAITHEETRTRLVPIMESMTVDMTPEEESEIIAEMPQPMVEEQSRLDDIEAALIELAAILGGTEQ